MERIFNRKMLTNKVRINIFGNRDSEIIHIGEPW